MSEKVPASVAIEVLQQAHITALKELHTAMRARQEAQESVEAYQAHADDLGDFIAQLPAALDRHAPSYEESAAAMQLFHASKFRGLVAPACFAPARAITLVLSHPDVGDQRFAPMLEVALHEFATFQAEAEDKGIQMGMLRSEDRYPFTASNGVKVEVEAHVVAEPDETVTLHRA